MLDARRDPDPGSGRRGIRTPGTRKGTPVFKTGALNQTQPSVLNRPRRGFGEMFCRMSHYLNAFPLI